MVKILSGKVIMSTVKEYLIGEVPDEIKDVLLASSRTLRKGDSFILEPPPIFSPYGLPDRRAEKERKIIYLGDKVRLLTETDRERKKRIDEHNKWIDTMPIHSPEKVYWEEDYHI